MLCSRRRFLGVGIIYVSTHETNLYRLGGLLAGSSDRGADAGCRPGDPGCSGAEQVCKQDVAAMRPVSPRDRLPVAGVGRAAFVVTGVGSAASFIKLYYLIFLRKPGEEAHRGNVPIKARRMPGNNRICRRREGHRHGCMPRWGCWPVAMVGIGVAPGFLPKLVIPVVRTPGRRAGALPGLRPSLCRITSVPRSGMPGTFSSIIITLIVGMLVCIAGLRLGIFHWKPPVWMTEEGLGKMAAKGVLRLWDEGAREYHVIADNAHESGDALKNRLYSFVRKFDRARSGTVGRVTVTGISADAALLFVILALLIVWYIIVHPDIPESWLWIFRTQQ